MPTIPYLSLPPVLSVMSAGGAMVLDQAGEQIGIVTSGCPSPTLKKNIAMACILSPFSKPQTDVQLNIRNKTISANVVSMPFVPTNYFM